MTWYFGLPNDGKRLTPRIKVKMIIWDDGNNFDFYLGSPGLLGEITPSPISYRKTGMKNIKNVQYFPKFGRKSRPLNKTGRKDITY